MANARLAVGTINLRSSRDGGSVARASDPVYVPSFNRTLIVLVHGYATPPHAAAREYGRFIDNLRAQTALGRLPADISVVRVLWPGSDPNPAVSALSFSSRIDAAEDAGRRLSQALTDSGATDLVVVGHSLGCRAVLELLVDLEFTTDPATVRLALLMAAAVPESACTPAGNFASDLMPSPRQIVLHSKRDFVLKALFRPGMRLARRGWAHAVGYTGGPKLRWAEVMETRLGHTGYWRASETAEILAEELGFAAARSSSTRDSLHRNVEESILPRRLPASRIAPRRTALRLEDNG